jgi:hypothetical protein
MMLVLVNIIILLFFLVRIMSFGTYIAVFHVFFNPVVAMFGGFIGGTLAKATGELSAQKQREYGALVSFIFSLLHAREYIGGGIICHLLMASLSTHCGIIFSYTDGED